MRPTGAPLPTLLRTKSPIRPHRHGEDNTEQHSSAGCTCVLRGAHRQHEVLQLERCSASSFGTEVAAAV